MPTVHGATTLVLVFCLVFSVEALIPASSTHACNGINIPLSRWVAVCRSTTENRETASPRRRTAFVGIMAGFCAQFVSPETGTIPPAEAKSYSQNARNFERLNDGDASGGSVYDNNPSSPGARKRRAMTGCKIPSARNEAAAGLAVKSLSEKDCNRRVLEGDTTFMLQAMQKLDCPTCPYGVAERR